MLKDKDLLGFKAVSVSTQDKVIVPQGYEAKVLISWGDSLFSKAKLYDENKIISVNPRTKNVYGHILKWMPKNSHKDDDFTWEIFAFIGNPDNQQGLYKGSNNITSENKFNSPDGLKFDRDGRL